jgi:Rrf2 family protein
MLTRRAKYAFKALMHLSRHADAGPIEAGAIASAEQIPRKFLEGILADLKRQGVVRSKSGKGGGHMLARPPAAISVLMVIRAIDGPVAPLPCLSRTAYVRCLDCDNEVSCQTRRLFAHLHQQTIDLMAETTIATVMDAGWLLVEAPSACGTTPATHTVTR